MTQIWFKRRASRPQVATPEHRNQDRLASHRLGAKTISNRVTRGRVTPPNLRRVVCRRYRLASRGLLATNLYNRVTRRVFLLQPPAGYEFLPPHHPLTDMNNLFQSILCNLREVSTRGRCREVYLLCVVDDQGHDHTWNPAYQGQYRGDDDRTAAFIDYG